MSLKSFQELPFETLFQMAEEKYESLDYEEAEYFYSLAYNKNPHDEVLTMCYANLLKTTQNEKKAQQILERSIKEVPSGTYKRYMELADIYQGVKSIQTFQKGIDNAIACLKNPFKATAPQSEIKRDIAIAYASIAQVCLTDLLDEKQAEGKCVQAMQKGQKMDPTCIDIHIQRANYLMWKDDFQTAKTHLLELYRWIKEEREEYETQTITTVGKYLIEVEEYVRSRELFQKLHEDVSNEIETIYMLAYCSFKLNEWAVCEEYIEEYDEKAEQKRKNEEILDEEVEEAVAEMKAELLQKKKEIEDTGEDEGEWMDVQEDDQE